MKKLFLILIAGLFSLSVYSQTVVADGMQHKAVNAGYFVRDTSFVLNTPVVSGNWMISVPWTASASPTSSIRLQAMAGNKWVYYSIDSCSVATTSGVCAWEDSMINFDKLRIVFRVTADDTIRIQGIYYRFTK